MTGFFILLREPAKTIIDLAFDAPRRIVSRCPHPPLRSGFRARRHRHPARHVLALDQHVVSRAVLDVHLGLRPVRHDGIDTGALVHDEQPRAGRVTRVGGEHH